MNKFKKEHALIFFLLALLVLRDAPYVNTIFINKVWIGYVGLIFFLASFYLDLNSKFYSLFLVLFLVVAFTSSFFILPLVSDFSGIVIYLSFWILLVFRIKKL